MTDKVAFLRGVLAVAEQRTTDPAGLAVIMELARIEGDLLADAMAWIMVPDPASKAREDRAVAEADEYLNHRAAELRASGTAENEVAAFTACFSIAVIDGFARLMTEVRAAQAGPIH